MPGAAPRERGRQVVLKRILFRAVREAAGREKRGAQACLGEADAFAGGCHAEPVRASFFESLGDLRTTVAVGVALNNGENFSGRLALFGCWVHVVADGAKISGERGGRNFGPNGWADEIGGTRVFLAACH